MESDDGQSESEGWKPWTTRFHSTVGLWKLTKRQRLLPEARR